MLGRGKRRVVIRGRSTLRSEWSSIVPYVRIGISVVDHHDD